MEPTRICDTAEARLDLQEELIEFVSQFATWSEASARRPGGDFALTLEELRARDLKQRIRAAMEL